MRFLFASTVVVVVVVAGGGTAFGGADSVDLIMVGKLNAACISFSENLVNGRSFGGRFSKNTCFKIVPTPPPRLENS